jgi:catechol 2,3-dioxygenase-like lactoylglutathione lyase family enzyme
MSPMLHFDHVGITVADLDKVTEFFVGLGWEVEGRTFLEGQFLDVVCGLSNARTEMVSLRPPGGGTGIELATFIRPDNEPGSPDAMATQLGFRSIAFEVDDLRPMVERLAAEGYHPVGGVGEYEGAWLMATVRGPEGLLVSLAQRLA